MNQMLRFFHSALFYKNSRVSATYFVEDWRFTNVFQIANLKLRISKEFTKDPTINVVMPNREFQNNENVRSTDKQTITLKIIPFIFILPSTNFATSFVNIYNKIMFAFIMYDMY